MNDLLDTKEAAQYLHTTADTLAVWRSEKRYDIPYIKAGAKVLYRKSDLDKWLDSRTVSSGV